MKTRVDIRELIEKFLASDEPFKEVDWVKFGFSCRATARTTIHKICERESYGCYVSQRNYRLFLIRFGETVPKEYFKQPPPDEFSAEVLPKYRLEKYLLDFLKLCPRDVMWVDWKSLNYCSPDSCASSFTLVIKRIGLQDDVGLQQSNQELWMFKKLRNEGEFSHDGPTEEND